MEIVQKGLHPPEQDLDYFCGYFFDKGDTHFRFDGNFVEEGKWQKKLVFAQQPLIVAVMGIGTGKTLGVGMAAYTWAMSTSDFKFMNGARWEFQSKQMKDLVLEQVRDTPAEKFIDSDVDTPYPKITLRFKVGRASYRSTMEFMSMDNQAKKIFTWRGDWINLDEAAFIDQLDIALMNLATRLTGTTGRGREYLGRMSLMTNAWNNESAHHVYSFYDLALDNPDECLSISIPTSANRNVTDRQINNALRLIRDEDEQERLLVGNRPEGKGIYFAKGRVEECADIYLSDFIRQKSQAGEIGYKTVDAMPLGTVEYQMPRVGNQHFLLGDPGTGGFPARNSPCIGVVDASRLPDQPALLTAFWWGNGNGHIQPFIDKFYEYKDKYQPMFAGVDSTGPQAGMVQILNLQKIWDGIQKTSIGEKVPITGMDFSVGRKAQMLVSLRNMIELSLLHWASMAKGIKQQLFNYDPLMDRQGVPKIAQDIVAMLAMAAFVVRAYYNVATPEEVHGRAEPIPLLDALTRDIRAVDAARSFRR